MAYGGKDTTAPSPARGQTCAERRVPGDEMREKLRFRSNLGREGLLVLRGDTPWSNGCQAGGNRQEVERA